MRAIAVTKSRILLVLAVIAAGLMYGGSTASAATVSINLCAVPGTATLTGAVTVPIWGFGIPATPGDCSTATASLPGRDYGEHEQDPALRDCDCTHRRSPCVLAADHGAS